MLSPTTTCSSGSPCSAGARAPAEQAPEIYRSLGNEVGEGRAQAVLARTNVT